MQMPRVSFDVQQLPDLVRLAFESETTSLCSMSQCNKLPDRGDGSRPPQPQPAAPPEHLDIPTQLAGVGAEQVWRDARATAQNLVERLDQVAAWARQLDGREKELAAKGTVWESLRGNAVFIVKLHGTGNLVLVHPIEEDGATFLPCCYGYATTIRRAQGASLEQGCIWFNQKRHCAGFIKKIKK